jgi:hypothetical protein
MPCSIVVMKARELPPVMAKLLAYIHKSKGLEDCSIPHGWQTLCRTGWLPVLSPSSLNQFPGQVINLHPALPGKFDGVS